MSKEKQVAAGEQEQFWRMVLEACRESGLSVSAFCRQEGFSEAAYYYWRKKLESAGSSKEEPPGDSVQVEPQVPKPVVRRPKSGIPPKTAAGSATAAGSFVEVSLPAERAAGLELALSSGNTLRIPAGVDGETVRQVIVLCKRSAKHTPAKKS